MKRIMMAVVIAVAATACNGNIAGLGRPVLVGSSGGNAAATTGVILSPSTSSIPVGSVVQLGARAVSADGSTAAGVVSWSSSNSAIATVDGNGVVTGRGAGNAVITATVNGVSGSAVVTVTATP